MVVKFPTNDTVIHSVSESRLIEMSRDVTAGFYGPLIPVFLPDCTFRAVPTRLIVYSSLRPHKKKFTAKQPKL